MKNIFYFILLIVLFISGMIVGEYKANKLYVVKKAAVLINTASTVIKAPISIISEIVLIPPRIIVGVGGKVIEVAKAAIELPFKCFAGQSN